MAKTKNIFPTPTPNLKTFDIRGGESSNGIESELISHLEPTIGSTTAASRSLIWGDKNEEVMGRKIDDQNH